MIKKEYEMKMMLTKQEYHRLIRMFKHLKHSKTIQTNYYYDTPTGALRSQNITLRIREKNSQLTATLKRHLKDENCSIEKTCPVNSVPPQIKWANRKTVLMGSLQTHRLKWQIMDGVLLVMDRNSYLGVVDYEMELEYRREHFDKAVGVFDFVRFIVGETGARTGTVSKSERFFKRFFSQ